MRDDSMSMKAGSRGAFDCVGTFAQVAGCGWVPRIIQVKGRFEVVEKNTIKESVTRREEILGLVEVAVTPDLKGKIDWTQSKDIQTLCSGRGKPWLVFGSGAGQSCRR